MKLFVRVPWSDRLVNADVYLHEATGKNYVICMAGIVAYGGEVVIEPDFDAKSARMQAENFAKTLRGYGYRNVSVKEKVNDSPRAG